MKIKGQFAGGDAAFARIGVIARAPRSKLLRTAVGEGTKPVYRAVKANARAAGDTGLLAKAIGRKIKVYRQSGVAVGVVGARKGFVRYVIGKNGRARKMDPIKYQHLVEYGTRRTRAKPFLRPAWDATKGEAAAAIAGSLREGIEGL